MAAINFMMTVAKARQTWQIQTDFSWTESDGPLGNIKHLNCNKNLVSVVYYTT